jgi:hypothetical protein
MGAAVVITEDLFVKKKTTRKVTPKTAAKKTTAKRVVKKGPAKKAMARKGGFKEWSAAEVRFLRQAYRTTTASEVARKLNRTVSAVRSKAVALSLKKAPMRKAAPKKVMPKRKPCGRW